MDALFGTDSTTSCCGSAHPRTGSCSGSSWVVAATSPRASLSAAAGGGVADAGLGLLLSTQGLTVSTSITGKGCPTTLY